MGVAGSLKKACKEKNIMPKGGGLKTWVAPLQGIGRDKSDV